MTSDNMSDRWTIDITLTGSEYQFLKFQAYLMYKVTQAYAIPPEYIEEAAAETGITARNYLYNMGLQKALLVMHYKMMQKEGLPVDVIEWPENPGPYISDNVMYQDMRYRVNLDKKDTDDKQYLINRNYKFDKMEAIQAVWGPSVKTLGIDAFRKKYIFIDPVLINKINKLLEEAKSE
jgi:hypothetical protein